MSRNFIILPSMKLTIAELAEILKGKVVGEDNTQLFKLSKIEDAKKGDITFVSNPRYLPWLYKTKASVVIVGGVITTINSVTVAGSAYSVGDILTLEVDTAVHGSGTLGTQALVEVTAIS